MLNHALHSDSELANLNTVDQFHRSLKEFNKKLIAVTSCLDAAVANINVLCSMENQCYAAFKLLLQDILILRTILER